jgi:IclR family transcriptional regulator, acetate operon repressor
MRLVKARLPLTATAIHRPPDDLLPTSQTHTAKCAPKEGWDVADIDRPLVTGPAGRPPTRGRIGRAMTVSEILADADRAVGVSEAARQAGLPKSTTARLLADFVDAGAATRTGGRYRAGPRLMALAAQLESGRTQRLRRLVLPHLVRLHDQTGLDVAFATLRYEQVRFEVVLYGQTRAELLAPLPLWAPTHCTCTGKVLLAYTPPQNTSTNPASVLTPYTNQTITDPTTLAHELAQVRREGIAYHRSEYLDGIDGLAVPILTGQATLLGAMAVCGASDGFDIEQTRTALRNAAHAASHAATQP